MPLRILLAVAAVTFVTACNGDSPAQSTTDTVTSSPPTDDNSGADTVSPLGEPPLPVQEDEVFSACHLAYSLGGGGGDNSSRLPVPRGHWDYENYVRWTPDGSRILFDVSKEPFWGSAVLYSVTTEPSLGLPYPSLEKIVAPSSQALDPLGDSGGTMMFFDVSPDGSHIVYSDLKCTFVEHDDRWIYDYEIMLSRLDGTEDAVRLTENTIFDNFPVWSPDGNRIAFVTSPLSNSAHAGQGRLRIYTLPQDSNSEGTLHDIELPISDKLGNSDLVGKAALRWSPDGQRIALVTFEYLLPEDRVTPARAYNSGVYTVKADGTYLTNITENAASGPAWSPDGQRIAVVTYNSEEIDDWPGLDFNEDPTNLIELRTFAADGSNPAVIDTDWLVFWEVQPGGFREVSTSSGEAETYSYYLSVWSNPVFPWVGDLSWSRDGSEILLESSAVRVPLDGSPLSIPIPECIITKHIHEGVGKYWYPNENEGLPMLAAWSPDGSRIAVRLTDVDYSSSRYSMDESPTSALLYTVNRDGTSPKLLAVQGLGEEVYSDAYGTTVDSLAVSPPLGGDFSC